MSADNGPDDAQPGSEPDQRRTQQPDQRRTDVPGQSGDAVQPGGPAAGADSGPVVPGEAGEPVMTREGLQDPREAGHTASPGTGMPRRDPQPPAHSAGRKRRRRRGDPNAVVPDAEFTSYYGRPIVKPSPWTIDIPIYLFLGGLAGSSALLGAGGAHTGRPAMRAAGRITALGALAGSGYFLVHDLGRPLKFYNMLRIAKPTSPMSVGTWFLTGFGIPAAVAGGSDIVRLLPTALTRFVPGALLRVLHAVSGPAGLASAAIGPFVTTYTAVLLADTATPAWHSMRKELPFVFAASATAAGAGLMLVTVPLAESGPARALSVAAAAVELGAQVPMRTAMGISEETLHMGTAGRWHQVSRVATVAGGVLAAVSGRSRALSAVSGAALVVGSLATRFAVFGAGQESAKNPKYTVVPQRERADAREAQARATGAPDIGGQEAGGTGGREPATAPPV